MGLKNNSTANVQYVKIKDGKFLLNKDETKTPHDELEGTLVDIYTKDEEYEGKPSKKLYVALEDQDTKFALGMHFDSSYASTFLSFIKNADLTQPLTLIPLEKEVIKDKVVIKKRSLLVKQNGTFLKGYFTQTEPNGQPQMKQVKVSGKLVWDKTDLLAFYEEVVDGLKSQLQGKKGVIVKEKAEKLPWDKEEESSDLPF